MKISFDSLNSNHNVDKVTTTQGNTASQGVRTESAYTIDISGTVMDNGAYTGHGRTAEEVMLNAEQGMLAAQQDYMTVMSNFMSEKDYAELEANGFDPKSVDTETIVTVVDEIKAKLLEAGIEIEGYNDDLDAEELARITGSDTKGRQIADKLRKNDIPVSKENVLEVGSALEKAEQLTELSDGAKKYLIQNKLDVDLDNVYRAQFSASSDVTRQAKGYYQEETTGYYAKKADNFNWDNLENQIEKVIEEADMDVTEVTIGEAKWLVQEGIPLTADSISRLHTINSVGFPIQTKEILNLIVNAVISGKEADKCSLNIPGNIYETADDILQQVRDITDEAVETVIENKAPFTIQNLNRAENNEPLIGTTKKDLSLVTARRQLEEVRLQMTFEANVKLLKSGYTIDTTELEQLVNDLKQQEQAGKEILFATSGAEEITAREELYQETLQKVSELPQMPAQLIGKVVFHAPLFTINYSHLQGTILRDDVLQAENAYETLMTAPRADLGDNIKKAFRNVDEILNDLNLEQNETNRRAVRILGYNQMLVTPDNITTVKQADLSLQRVIRKLTPGSTLQMIRDGKNPLNMNVQELEEYLSEKENEDDKTGKYSTYLYKLEKNNQITSEEKESYLGIYRLMRQIEKSDGAVIGSLLNQGAELNFKNLLTAVRNKKWGNKEYTIDDNFSGVQAKSEGKDIQEQIQTYYQTLVRDIQDHADTGSHADHRNSQLNRFEHNEISLETYHEMLLEENSATMNQSGNEGSDLADQQLRNQNLNDVRNIQYVNESTLQTLLDFSEPITVDNLVALDYLKQYRGSTIKQLFRHAEENGSDDYEDFEQSMYKLQRNLTDYDSAQSAYVNLTQTAKQILAHTTEKAGTYVDIKSMSNFHKQLNIASKLAKKENYEVPVKINGVNTSINLQIVRNSEQSGTVTISLSNELLGNVYAKFEATQKNDQTFGVKGIVAGSEQSGLEYLQNTEHVLKEELSTDICTVDELFFVDSKQIDIQKNNSSIAEAKDTQTQVNRNNVATGTLYQISKAFIIAIQSIKETDK